MALVQEHKRISPNSLYDTISQFVQDNAHNRAVEDRWLAKYLEGILPIIAQVRTGRLDEVNRKAAAEFRLAEIAKERASQELRILELDREAAKHTEILSASSKKERAS